MIIIDLVLVLVLVLEGLVLVLEGLVLVLVLVLECLVLEGQVLVNITAVSQSHTSDVNKDLTFKDKDQDKD